LGDSSTSPSTVLSVIRARELAQAKLAEAVEKEAVFAAVRATDPDAGAQSPSQQEGTSVVPLAHLSPKAGCLGEETGDPESIIVASLARKNKRKTPALLLPPRTNL
jgi:hypothetical protein